MEIMPTYVYFDPETDEEKEVHHSIHEDPEIVNESTGNVMKRKILATAGIIYKGDGWGGAGIKKDNHYHVDRHKDEIRGGIRDDPYGKYREPGEEI